MQGLADFAFATAHDLAGVAMVSLSWGGAEVGDGILPGRGLIRHCLRLAQAWFAPGTSIANRPKCNVRA